MQQVISYFNKVLQQNDGIIHTHKSDEQMTLVEKAGAELRLKLLSSQSTEWQSRIDLNHPDVLLSRYLQIMPMALLWVPCPLRVHIVGLGGAATPRYLYRHHPELHIDCTEIELAVYDIASRYFLLHEDERLKVFICDGRDYLFKRPRENLYDIIFVDAFCGVGFSPIRLSTQEFVQICKNQLSESGVLVFNILQSGGLVTERIQTIQSLFKNVYVCHDGGALVVFATDQEKVPQEELVNRAINLEATLYTDIPCIATSKLILHWQKNIDNELVNILTDNFPPESIPIPDQFLHDIGRNDLCPCGSRRKFKKCHGKNQG